MDFWDLTKVLARRWQIAVPGLVLTLGATAGIMATGEPRYIATSYVQVAPPVSRPTQAGEPSLEQRNPWLDMGVQILANTAMLTLEQPSVIESMKASGFSATYVLTLDDYSPLVTFEVTGDSRQAAIATTDELIRRYSASVTDLQVSVYGVAEPDLAAAKRLDAGNNITESNANIIRAAVAIGAVGLLFTFGLAIGADTLATRRARRRAGVGPGVDIEDLSPPPPAPTPPAGHSRSLASGPSADSAREPALAGARPAISPAVIAQPQPTPAASDEGSDVDADPAPDATVVLPLAYRAPRRQGRGTGLR